MRIGNNSQGIWQLLSRMNGGKANMNMPFAGAKRSSAGGRNTLEDRVAAAWTLGQLEISIGRRVASAVKEKVPGWTHGKTIPSDVLYEIFADESIPSMVSGETKGLDMKI